MRSAEAIHINLIVFLVDTAGALTHNLPRVFEEIKLFLRQNGQ